MPPMHSFQNHTSSNGLFISGNSPSSRESSQSGRHRPLGTPRASVLGRRQSRTSTRDASRGEVPSRREDDTDDNDNDNERDENDTDGDEADNSNEVFRPRPRLKSALVVYFTVDQIIQLLNSPYLNLVPPYQRNVVWSSRRMTGLINSLFENYYVPPVIFNNVPIEEHERVENESVPDVRRICVDGKQRLSSIRSFVMGEIPCTDEKGRKWYFLPKLKTSGAVNTRYRVLPEKVKDEFRSKEIVAYQFTDLSRDQEEDLFARVQEGMSLTDAEKLRATTGVWQDFATMFESDFDEVVKMCSSTRAGGWMRLLQSFSQILEVHNPSGPRGDAQLRTSKVHVSALTHASNLLTEATKTQLRRTYKTLLQIKQQYPKTFMDNNFTHVKTFAPLEFIAVTSLISLHPGRPRGMLQGDIMLIRKELRNLNVDLRLNGDMWRDAWKVISSIEDLRGATDPSLMVSDRSKTLSHPVPHRGRGRGRQPVLKEEEDSDDGDSLDVISRSRRDRVQDALRRNTGRAAAPGSMAGANDDSAQSPTGESSNDRQRRDNRDFGHPTGSARHLQKRIKRSPTSERAAQDAAFRDVIDVVEVTD